MEDERRALAARGIRIAVVTYDPIPVLAHFAARKKISFPLLSDPESKAIRAFGILNETVKHDSPAYGVPHPGTFITDAMGIVRSKYFEDDYRERYAAGTIVLREFNIASGNKTMIEAPHLKVATHATSGTVFPGRRITLIADIELPRKMHIYAPGVSGYIPVEWQMIPDRRAEAAPVSFPPARTLRLKAIGEKVPAYEKKVRLTRDVTVGTVAAMRDAIATGALELKGVLRFQACDDKQCYLPESIPLEWKFQAAKPDSERVPPEIRGKVK